MSWLCEDSSISEGSVVSTLVSFKLPLKNLQSWDVATISNSGQETVQAKGKPKHHLVIDTLGPHEWKQWS